MNKENQVPTHNLDAIYNVNVENISYENNYDDSQIHRHNYYEILFFKKGGGHQLIDFNKIPIRDYSCYIVKPHQVHLIEKTAAADGLLIQFTSIVILSDVVKNALSILERSINFAIVFEHNIALFNRFTKALNAINDIQKEQTLFFKQKVTHLLSNLLYELEEEVFNNNHTGTFVVSKIAIDFAKLVERYLNKFSVSDYASKLNVNTKRLTQVVKNQYGVTPLKYIHNMLLLEIKRDLVFKELTHKEIAYSYNFDSPQNFSLFVKKNTGLTPSELQEQLAN